ncbi:MAG: GAF domain-containing protein, partial [Anaerolineae bacterium]|nr:GAF domain-containing protein [Anaerolineae bacterium]
MSRTLDLDELVDTVLREIHRLIPCGTSTVFMLEPDTTVQVRRWNDGRIETGRVLPPDYLPEFHTSRIMRETGKPLIVFDSETDPNWITKPGVRPIRSWLGAPLFHRGEYLGEMSLDSPDPNMFDQEDAGLAYALAIQVASAVHNVRQFESEQRRARRLQALTEVSQAISRVDLAEVLEVVYCRVSELMDTAGFFIGLYDDETDTIRAAGFYDQGERRPDTIQSAQEGLSGMVLRTGESVIMLDTAHDPRMEQGIQDGPMPRSLLMMPLITQDEIVGLISVQSYETYAYTSDDIAMLEVIAGAVATAVRNARLYDQTRSQLQALHVLHQLGLDLAVTQSPEAVGELITQAALDLLAPAEAWLCTCCIEAPWPSMVWRRASADVGRPVMFEPGEIPKPVDLMLQVRESQTPVFMPDLSADEALPGAFDTDWSVQAVLLHPVRRGDQQIATLVLLYDQPHAFPKAERRIAEMLCLQTGSALETARHTITVTRRLREVTALHELARQVNEIESLDEILRTVVETVRDALGCRSASVALLDPGGETVSLRAGAGLDEGQYIAGHTFALGEYVVGAVVQSGEAIYVPDTQLDPGFRFIDPEIRALMSVPLTVQRRTIGALNIDADIPEVFTDHHERVLVIAGGQIAAAMENLRLLADARERAAQLAEANETLQAQDDLRRELVFQVSHDLRGPLQIVYGYTDMMHGEMLGPVTPTQKEILGLILKRSKSIERMTHDILAARPINREMLELQSVNLTELCQQAMIDAQMVYPVERFLFAAELEQHPLPVEVDYHRLSRVFDNLIGNAVKFSPEGGTIALRTWHDPATGEALVAISDQGIGITAEKLPFIFERFYRGDKAFRNRFEGAGLGLFIVQQIIEAHQGRIWVDSQDGEGSTFTFALPLVERD